MSHEPIHLPRWLGIPSPKMPSRAKEGERDDKPAYLVYEWDEYSFAPKPQETRQRAQDVMQRLPERGVVLILGVPGQGKSTLVKQWKKDLEPTRPVLLGECGLLNKLESKQEILLEILQQNANRKERQLLADFEKQSPANRLVLIVDALDELSNENRWSYRLAKSIKEASEQVLVVLTCRTHVWTDKLEKIFREELTIQLTYTLLGFTPSEQLDYLLRWTEANGKPSEQAETLAKKIKQNAQLRSLAANALLLSLIARVALEEKITLPASRAEFYKRAIDKMWKHAIEKEAISGNQSLLGMRDRFLRALGLVTLGSDGLDVQIDPEKIGLAWENAKIPEEKRDQLVDALRKSGLLVPVGNDTSNLRFVHLTFQEYALAQGLILGVGEEEPKPAQASERLENALVNYWDKPQLEPTLALAVAIASANKADLFQPFAAVLNSWVDGKPSALVQAMHLYTASAITDSNIAELLVQRLPVHFIAQYQAAIDEQTPREILQQLSFSSNSRIKWLVAGNPNTPSTILHQLASNEDSNVLGGIARNLNTPEETLRQLASSKDSFVLSQLAGNLNTPNEILKQLASVKNSYIFKSLACNPNALAEALQQLALNEDLAVLYAVARNPNTLVEVLQQLASRRDSVVLVGLAENPNTPIEILEQLGASEDLEVLKSLARTPSTPIQILKQLASYTDSFVLWRLAQNPNTPAEILERLASSEDKYMLEILAENPSTPVEVLQKLASFGNLYIGSLARNPSTPKEILRRLAYREEFILNRSLAENPNTQPDMLYKLVSSIQIPQEQFSEIDLDLLWGLAYNPSTPAIVFQLLASTTDETILLRVAENPSFVLEWLLPPPKQTSRDPDITLSEPIQVGVIPFDLEKPRWNPAKESSPEQPTKVLFLPSDNAPRIGLLDEQGKVRRALRNVNRKYAEHLVFEPRELGTSMEIRQGLLDLEPQIVHFAGHGSEDGKLYMRDGKGGALLVDVEGLKEMLKGFECVRCVILNACYSVTNAKILLELEHIKYVVATQEAIKDEAAIQFSEAFYQTLGNGQDIGRAFHQGRVEIQWNLSGLQEHLKPVLLERNPNPPTKP